MASCGRHMGVRQRPVHLRVTVTGGEDHCVFTLHPCSERAHPHTRLWLLHLLSTPGLMWEAAGALAHVHQAVRF